MRKGRTNIEVIYARVTSIDVICVGRLEEQTDVGNICV